ncbi:hypothetical protein [uncultured Paenibacillus sp.]|uniref:hypothetical protein n=1 Tax=uncultured Paenibacillus sp. TaxID=227322 RepID=UPI0028D87983|nr:hypothetical protein [uncultured Paenibacillus sp.]
MNRKLIKQGIIAATSLTLLLHPSIAGMPYHSTVSAAPEVNTSLVNKVVRLNPASTLSIRDAKLLMQDKGLLLAYTVAITNNGNSTLDILDYWIRVKGKNGKTFSTLLSETDKQKTKVAPKTTVNITYYTTVDSSTKLSDLSFDVVKWDFSAPNYERKLGTVKYPANSTGKTPAFQGSVMIFNNTKIKGALKQYYITQDQSAMYLTVSFLLENVGYSSASMANMGFAIQTDSYSVYDVNAAALAQMTIQPKERRIITMQAKLPMAVAGKSVAIVPYTKDDTNKVKLPNGSFAIPPLKPAVAAPAGAAKSVYMEGQPVETTAGQAILNENDGSTDVSMEFVLKNSGLSALKLPGLEFTIRTKDDISYPLGYTKEENAVILPKIQKTLDLTGSIPSAVDGNTSELIVKTVATEGQEGYVIGKYKIQAANQQGSVGGSFSYNKDYRIQLRSIQRQPLESDDVIMAELNIVNISNSSKKTPINLNGYFLINGVKVEAQSTAVGLDQIINIAPNGTYQMVVYTKIPYTTTVDRIAFVLTEGEKDKPAKTLFQFSGQSLSPYTAYSLREGYAVTNIGGKAGIKLLKSNIFNGDKTSYFYTEFEAINLETRAADLVKLGGYLLDDQGQTAPLKVAEFKEKVMSNGKVLISATAEIGKSFNMQNYQLIFGQSVVSAGAAPDTKPETVVVKPVAYKMANAETAVENKLTDIRFSAYTLSLKNVTSQLSVSGQFNVEGVKLYLDYDLAVNKSYDYIAGEHKVLLEFVDQETTKATYSKEFALIKAAENQTALKEGKMIPLEIVYNDTDIQNKVRDYKTYKLNVYDVVDNAKVLVASKELRWFTREP